MATRKLPPVKTYSVNVDLPVIAEAKRTERRRNRLTYGLLGLVIGFFLGAVSGLVLVVF